MRNIVAKLVIGVAITSIESAASRTVVRLVIGFVSCGVDLVFAMFRFQVPIELSAPNMAGGVKVTSTGQRKDGTAINASYTVKYDGKEYPVTGAAWDTVSIKQIDANTFTSEQKKTGGKYHTTGRTVISKDGKTMTITNKGTNADGKPSSATLIYEKQ